MYRTIPRAAHTSSHTVNTHSNIAQPHPRLRALRRMKLIATAALVLMTIVFIIARQYGTQSLVWVVRWDHLAAFAEASMVGALADWFAVVALFRHPMGIPIWHTAIIPKRRDDISRSISAFVETKLLSLENVSAEIDRFSPAAAAVKYLSDPAHRHRAAGWLAGAAGALFNALRDDEVEQILESFASRKLNQMNAAGIIGDGLGLLVESRRHEKLLDNALHYAAQVVPAHRATIREFIDRSIERTLKWGSNLVPDAAVEHITDKVLASLIEVLVNAAEDPAHPLRTDLRVKFEEWADDMKSDAHLQEKVNAWKNDLVNHPRVRGYVADLWAHTKKWVSEDLEKPDSAIHGFALRVVDGFYDRLRHDPEARTLLDNRLRSGAMALLESNHHQIGALVLRVVNQWDGPRLARELELSLGKDLQYIRLNGTLIGGLVGLLIHLIF